MTYYGLYKDANRLLDKSKISLGEYERMIEPLNDEVRKVGKWIETSEGTMCSNCYKFPYDDGEYHIANWRSDFCPNCGAKMERSE